MCGIVGIYNWPESDRALCERSVRLAMERMAHRGPDGAGVFRDDRVVFGHRRLAVIAPRTAGQPWVDPETGTVLVYNGEIYNFRDLRSRLESLASYNFRTDSDTEVLARAYVQWGADCARFLDGIFAFAAYSPESGEVLLVRDRLGVKPLFYLCRGDGLVFASTVAAMLSLPQVPHRLDLPAVSHYLTSVRTSLGRRSLIRDVSALQPGETLSLAPGREAVLRTYWRIPVVAAGDKPDPGLGAAAEQACSLLREAVTAQMVSDVPLGGFLSGGLDSCAITHFAHARTAEAYRTYNVGYEGEGYNEWPFARESAAFYGVPCDIECLSADGYPGVWQRLIREKGLPLSTPNEVPIVHLAEALRQTCTVALSGEGSDEIFGGYPIPHFSARDFELSRRSPPGPDSVLSPFERNLEQVYGRCFFHCLADHYFAGNSWIPMARKRLLLTDSAWETLEEDDALFCWYEDLFDELAPCTAFDAYMHVHARVNLEGLLSRVDSSTMSASVEARVPFTDHRLVEFLFSLPDSHKIDWLDAGAREQGLSLPAVELDRRGLLETKRLLRRGLQGAVPDSILRRPKMSFPVPFPAWFADSWRPLATAAVEASSLPGSLFDAGAVQALLSGSDLPLNALALWPVVNLCLWQTEWNLSL